MKQHSDAGVPILLLGDTRKRIIAEYVRASVERWRRAWAEDPKPRIAVEIAGTESLVGRWSSRSCFLANSERGSLCLFVAPRCLPAIAGLRGLTLDTAHRQVDPDTLAAGLELEALQRLVGDLVGGARGDMTSLDRNAAGRHAAEHNATERGAAARATLERTTLPIPAAIRQLGATRCAVASITLGDAEATFSIALSPAFVASLLPTRNDFALGERVEPRRAAAAEQPVGIEAVLGHAEVSVRDLALLAVGDVIVMDESLSDPGSLQIEGGGRVCRVMPGRLDSRRAVQFRGKIQ